MKKESSPQWYGEVAVTGYGGAPGTHPSHHFSLMQNSPEASTHKLQNGKQNNDASGCRRALHPQEEFAKGQVPARTAPVTQLTSIHAPSDTPDPLRGTRKEVGRSRLCLELVNQTMSYSAFYYLYFDVSFHPFSMLKQKNYMHYSTV